MPIEPPEQQADPLTHILAGVRQYAHSDNEKTGREALVAGNRQYLASLSDRDFAQLVAEVRPPADATPDDGPAYPADWGYQPKPTD